MKQFLELLKDIRDNGTDTVDRTGTGCRKVFGRMTRFKLSDGFPLVTTRHVPIKAIIHEMLWFLKGSDNVKELQDAGVKIWDNWAVKDSDVRAFLSKITGQDIDSELINNTMEKEDGPKEMIGSIGSIYGPNWRNVVCPDELVPPNCGSRPVDEIASDRQEALDIHYTKAKEQYPDVTKEEVAAWMSNKFVDQIQELLVNLKKRPFSRRHVVSSWNPVFLPNEDLSPQENVLRFKGALAPCHVLQQYHVLPAKEEGGKNRLSLNLYMRSNDTPVGACFNIAQYAVLLMMVAQVVDMEADEFILTVGDQHIYADQLDLVEEQLQREPRPLPMLKINPEVKDLFSFKIEDFELVGYNPHPKINYPVAI